MEKLDESLARLVKELSSTEGVEPTASKIVEFARSSIGASHAGVTMLRRGGRLETVAPTSEVVVEADRLQYALKEGPCVAVAVTATHAVLSDDVIADERWPAWGERAAELGIRSMLSVELDTGERRLGALNLYGDRRRQFSHDDAHAAHLFAHHAAAAVAAAASQAGLRRALDSRTLIGQAEGILMERFSLDEQQAFALLRRYSQDTQLRLRDVARRVVDDRTLPET